MTGITRDSSGQIADLVFSGGADFWTGKPFDAKADAMWQQGWLAAADTARRRAADAAPLLDPHTGIVAILTDAYAALRRASDLPKLLPGTRSRINSTLVRMDKLLAQLMPAIGTPSPRPPREEKSSA